jgi:hypothetical protein
MNKAEQETRYTEWSKRVQEQEKSELSLKVFCAQKNLSLSQFKYYRGMIRRQKSHTHHTAAKFAPVKIRNKDSVPGSGDIKLSLPNGFQCTFPMTLESTRIKELIRIFLSC